MLLTILLAGCSEPANPNSTNKMSKQVTVDTKDLQITLSAKTGLPDDLPIPDFMTFERVEQVLGQSMTTFASSKPYMDFKLIVRRSGWKDAKGGYFYKCRKELTYDNIVYQPEKLPLEARVYAMASKSVGDQFQISIYQVRETLQPSQVP